MDQLTVLSNGGEIDEEDPEAVLDEEAVERLNSSFGKGINKRRILVGPAHTLKSIKTMSE